MTEFYTANAAWIDPLVATLALAAAVVIIHLRAEKSPEPGPHHKVMVASGAFKKWS